VAAPSFIDTTIDSMPSTPTASRSAHFLFSRSEPAVAIARFECALDTAAFAACGSPFDFTGLADGVHTFAVRAVATFGLADPTPATYTWVVDATAPTLTVIASIPVLGPPNGKMVNETIAGSVADAVSGVALAAVTFRVVDEYGEIEPSGGVTIAADGRFAFIVALEASRLGTDKDGRRYDVIVSASDNAGNRVSSSTTVVVAHDRGK
jgi:hypothetical protein